MPSRNKVAAGAKGRLSRAVVKAGQEREHARVRAGAPQERAGAVQEQSRNKTAAEARRRKSRAGAKAGQEREHDRVRSGAP